MSANVCVLCQKPAASCTQRENGRVCKDCYKVSTECSAP